jgi:beta-lactam-binding protein with PASTA domain
LTGQNAKIAEDKLEALGLNNVTLASATPKYTMVLAPQNWTVVSTEPAAGTSVSSGDSVVVKVTKP